MSDRKGNLRYPSDPTSLGDPWEQLQDVILWCHNRRVIEEFRDLTPQDQEWEANLNTPRARLRFAVTIKDDDSAIMMLHRMWLFYVVMGKAADFQTPIYGIPITGFQEARKFAPQIQLYFVEDVQDVEQGYSPVTGQITFRLMDQTSDTLTEAELNSYALKVRSTFATGNGFVWKKGKTMASYTDRAKGYQLQLLVRSEAEGRRVVEQVLDIQNHTPNWGYLNISENQNTASRYPTVPPTDFILGRSRRLPRSRPVADVRFQHAVVHIHGLPNPVVLVDRSRTFRNPLVRV
jgi:hypothetical protein